MVVNDSKGSIIVVPKTDEEWKLIDEWKSTCRHGKIKEKILEWIKADLAAKKKQNLKT